jgi:dTDP-4-dehydrorhamnose 3,5-epimerase
MSALEHDSATALPDGVRLMPLTTHADGRGDFTEIFRNEWHNSPVPVQWNVSRTGLNALRGVHVHALHWDYLCVMTGEMVVGLHDLRPEARNASRSVMLRLAGSEMRMLSIPPGVCHGFYSPHGSVHVIGASTYYNPPDHRRCRWDDPELGLDWPCTSPELSRADREAPSYGELKAAFLAAVAAARSPA